MQGYIKLHRKSLDSAVFKSPNLWQVWCYCLMRANHKETKIFFNNQEITLKPGQFITGRFAGAKDCHMKESTFRNQMRKLQKLENLDIKSDNKKSLVTIVNWAVYQCSEINEDSKKTSKRTTRGHRQECKNERSIYCEDSIEYRISEHLYSKILNNDSNFKTPDFQKWAVHIDELIRLDKRTPEEIISVINWTQNNTFWKGNVLSTSKLRAQFPQLIIKMNNETNQVTVNNNVSLTNRQLI